MTRAKLPVPVGRTLDDDGACSAREIQQMWHAIDAARSPRARSAGLRSWPRALAAAALLAGLSAVAMHVLTNREPRPLQLAAGGALPLTIAPLAQFRAVDLGDGSRITVARGAELDLLESSATKLVLALRRGRARFDVRPHGPRTWQVECADVTVQVVGTAFVVERAAAEVRVSVERGVVLVRGQGVPDRVQRIGARARFVARDASVPAAPAEATPRGKLEPDGVTHSVEPSWREAARRRQWNSAWSTLRSDGLIQQTRRADRVEDLLLLADVARLSGHPQDAVAPLQRVSERSRDARAGLAALMLGRLRLDELDEPRRAAADLARALDLGLPGTLEQDARARIVQAYGRAGMREQARAAAAEYHRRFPRGARAEEVERWSGGGD